MTSCVSAGSEPSPVTSFRSFANSLSGYASGEPSSPCAHRMFRVYLLLPPRQPAGARSRRITSAPAEAAEIAAHRAAFPPPITSVSHLTDHTLLVGSRLGRPGRTPHLGQPRCQAADPLNHELEQSLALNPDSDIAVLLPAGRRWKSTYVGLPLTKLS